MNCRIRRASIALLAAGALLLAALPAAAEEMPVQTPRAAPVGNGPSNPDAIQTTDYVPPALVKAREAAGVDEKLDQPLPMDLKLVDSSGQTVRLGDYFQGDRPVLIQMAYYRCPMLCGRVSQGMVTSMKSLADELTIGEDFQVLTISFDARETPELAAENKAAAVEVMGRVSSKESVRQGWAHLVGDDLAIKELTKALGYRFGWVEEAQEYSHPAVIVLATPDGRISRYLYGVSFEPTDLRLSLINASEGTITPSLKDAFILSCFDFDPTTGKYTATAYTVMRIAGVVTVLTMAAVITFLVVAERKGRLGRHKYAGTPAEEAEVSPAETRTAFSG